MSRTVPEPTEVDAPFWSGARRHELVLPRCDTCGRWFFPPHRRCPNCLAANVIWGRVSGRGDLYGWVEMHRAYRPFALEVPYNVVVVRLDEGPLMISNMTGVVWDELRLGLPVGVYFEQISDEITLPLFAPIAS